MGISFSSGSPRYRYPSLSAMLLFVWLLMRWASKLPCPRLLAPLELLQVLVELQSLPGSRQERLQLQGPGGLRILLGSIRSYRAATEEFRKSYHDAIAPCMYLPSLDRANSDLHM